MCILIVNILFSADAIISMFTSHTLGRLVLPLPWQFDQLQWQLKHFLTLNSCNNKLKYWLTLFSVYCLWNIVWRSNEQSSSVLKCGSGELFLYKQQHESIDNQWYQTHGSMLFFTLLFVNKYTVGNNTEAVIGHHFNESY